MQEQQVFEIEPDAGLQTAWIRAQGATGGAQRVQGWKNNLQT